MAQAASRLCRVCCRTGCEWRPDLFYGMLGGGVALAGFGGEAIAKGFALRRDVDGPQIGRDDGGTKCRK